MTKAKIIWARADHRPEDNHPLTPVKGAKVSWLLVDSDSIVYYAPEPDEYIVKYGDRRSPISVPFASVARTGMEANIEFEDIDGEKIVTSIKLIGVKEEK